MKKKKIIFIAKLPPPYIGPTVANNIILNSSLKNNFELIHLNISDHRDINTLGAIDFTNIFLAFKHYFMLTISIIKNNPDLIYSPIGQTTISYVRDSLFVIIAKLFGKKIVCHLRGGNFINWYEQSSGITRWYVRLLHKKIDAQIVLGENLKNQFNWLIPERKIFVIPNGADYNFTKSKTKDEYINIIYLSNFIRSKGIMDFLFSTKFLTAYSNKIKIVIAGKWGKEPKLKEEIKNFIQENNISIQLHEEVYGDKKKELLENADIFVLPTYYPNEGHPWVIVEAMAAGLPIISTDHAAITQSVKDHINGFIVEKNNPEQIAEKLKLLIEDENLRKKMGEESRRLYLENFTEEKMVENLSRIFYRVTDYDRN